MYDETAGVSPVASVTTHKGTTCGAYHSHSRGGGHLETQAATRGTTHFGHGQSMYASYVASAQGHTFVWWL